MSKRHNRKRTRSRPRHRDAGKARSLDNKSRADSIDSFSSRSVSYPSSFPPPFSFPLTVLPADHWHQTYSVWQGRLRMEQLQALEAQRLRFFGGEVGDEVSLFEPMLKVVTDLFDGNIDYVDP